MLCQQWFHLTNSDPSLAHLRDRGDPFPLHPTRYDVLEPGEISTAVDGQAMETHPMADLNTCSHGNTPHGSLGYLGTRPTAHWDTCSPWEHTPRLTGYLQPMRTRLTGIPAAHGNTPHGSLGYLQPMGTCPTAHWDTCSPWEHTPRLTCSPWEHTPRLTWICSPSPRLTGIENMPHGSLGFRTHPTAHWDTCSPWEHAPQLTGIPAAHLPYHSPTPCLDTTPPC